MLWQCPTLSFPASHLAHREYVNISSLSLQIPPVWPWHQMKCGEQELEGKNWTTVCDSQMTWQLTEVKRGWEWGRNNPLLSISSPQGRMTDNPTNYNPLRSSDSLENYPRYKERPSRERRGDDLISTRAYCSLWWVVKMFGWWGVVG